MERALISDDKTKWPKRKRGDMLLTPTETERLLIFSAAELARKGSEEAAAKSKEAFAQADPTNLGAREEAEGYADDAIAAKAAATRAARRFQSHAGDVQSGQM